ncbi:MAG: hypothetical protein IPH45_14700 [Bacteroidales bacterium]|nr:hypothetical protein [Bacteroidales bacterium]
MTIRFAFVRFILAFGIGLTSFMTSYATNIDSIGKQIDRILNNKQNLAKEINSGNLQLTGGYSSW